MSDQKYYLIVNKLGTPVTINSQIPLFYFRNLAAGHLREGWKIIPIPAEELNQLIKKYRKR